MDQLPILQTEHSSDEPCPEPELDLRGTAAALSFTRSNPTLAGGAGGGCRERCSLACRSAMLLVATGGSAPRQFTSDESLA